MSRSIIVTTLVLFAFGAYEAFDAGLALFRAPDEGPLAELFIYPRWSLTHFLPGFLFMTLVPLQLWAKFRNRHRVVHRWSGRIVVACGAFLAVSGTLLPFTMPDRTRSEQFFMVIFGVAFVTFLAKAVAAARRRDFVRHREWMIRMFATGLTITTQRLFLPLFIVAGGLNSVERFWIYFVSAGWVGWAVTLGLAEWWIRRTRKVASGSSPKPQEPARGVPAAAGL
jgi:uncharacterized membrane protein